MRIPTIIPTAMVSAGLALTLGQGTLMAQAPASGTLELKSCEQANVGLRDLAINSRGSGARSFYEGNVLLLEIDQVEPAAASAGLVVLMLDPESTMGDRHCYAFTGFNGLDLDRARSSYSASTGLRVSIATSRYDHDTGTSKPGRPLVLRINASAGTVAASR
ncbi:MAG: hypothetical protein QNJ15_11515 [Erythrobacter sp.]|nr:hypothetical protein [Erythrobacter sp.]